MRRNPWCTDSLSVPTISVSNIIHDVRHAGLATIRKRPVGISHRYGQDAVFVVCLFGLSTPTATISSSSSSTATTTTIATTNRFQYCRCLTGNDTTSIVIITIIEAMHHYLCESDTFATLPSRTGITKYAISTPTCRLGIAGTVVHPSQSQSVRFFSSNTTQQQQQPTSRDNSIRYQSELQSIGKGTEMSISK